MFVTTLSISDFLSANTSFYTKLQSNANFLSATTFIPIDFYSKAQSNSNFLSANTSYYSQAQSNSNFLSANTFIPIDFYSKAQSNSNFLSANTSYYTQSQANSSFVSATTIISYYSSAQTQTILNSYSLTSHTHYLSGLLDVNTSGATTGMVLTLSGLTWIAEAVGIGWDGGDPSFVSVPVESFDFGTI